MAGTPAASSARELNQPTSAVLSGVVDFGLAFVVLLGMMLAYGTLPTLNILWLPVFLLLASLLVVLHLMSSAVHNSATLSRLFMPLLMFSLAGLVALVVLLGAGRLFGLTLPELVTASNAAILGATTAPALAAARGWHDLVTPGVLVGVLGYALGTFAGTAVFHLWG